MNISDNEAGLYNWKKNPGAEVTVVGLQESKSKYQANRYGVYHMTGKRGRMDQSIYRTYSRQHPYMIMTIVITMKSRANGPCEAVPRTQRA